ncbi:MAG TPA: ferric reductase-like transmembrane domain-containing protein [Chloroflexia bacterium]|nr:ferric reductase-like transmembrane domain-containing protein [Chloroflexia bacterium]
MIANYRKEHPRVFNNLVLASASLVGCIIAGIFAAPGQSILETLSVGFGYVGLILIAVSLLIGPINMLKVRKNPVNIMFRRDTGIWAAITSFAHVLFAFALQLSWGGTLLGLFFFANGAPKLNLFGISDYIGLFGTLILIFLLVLSNNHFLKALKGKRWKNMQRFNYLLFVLALGHTFTQQVNNGRGMVMIFGVLAVALAVLVAQSIGFVVYRKREQQRKAPAPAAKASSRAVKAQPVKGPELAQQRAVAGKLVATRSRTVIAPESEINPLYQKVAMVVLVAVGALAGYLGFEVAQGSLNGAGAGIASANNSSFTGTTSSNSASQSTSQTSSSSSGVQVNKVQSSAPQVVTGHS